MVQLREKCDAKDDLNSYYSWRCFKRVIMYRAERYICKARRLCSQNVIIVQFVYFFGSVWMILSITLDRYQCVLSNYTVSVWFLKECF